MAEQQIKGYQTGTFVVGNRLLDPEQRSTQARTERSNTLTSGHRACQGCGEALGARYALDAAMRASVQAGAGVKLGCDHTHYPAHVAIAAETLSSLAGDLR